MNSAASATATTRSSASAAHRKRWGALSIGASVEHTHYYDGIFGETTNIANDVNLFARYIWRPNPDLKITPAVDS